MKDDSRKLKGKEKKKELMVELVKNYEKKIDMANLVNKYSKKIVYIMYIVVATLFLVTIFSAIDISFLALILLIVALLLHIGSDYLLKMVPSWEKTLDMLKDYEKLEL